LGITAYFVIASRNRFASLRISDYVQLTHDGNAGGLRGTDGTRLYMVWTHPAVARPADEAADDPILSFLLQHAERLYMVRLWEVKKKRSRRDRHMGGNW
jgi:hypothetical protein